MKASKFWRTLVDSLISPKVDEAKVEECLRQAHAALPAPVFWLLGKTQSGKTSCIRALTDSQTAEIGNGFRACTRTARLYDFPNAEECLLRFLDTRGLGEAEYDPTEDIRFCEEQAHLLIVVIKAGDQAPQPLLEPLAKIRGAHPNWPVIVVQTALHELYPIGARHIEPYPYRDKPNADDEPAPVRPSAEPPSDLVRSLEAQREWFAGFGARFAPVDFTLPEDGLAPADYGLDALWDAIEDALPRGLRAMLRSAPDARRSLRDVYLDACRPHVISYSLATGVIAAGTFVPLVDMPLVVGAQLKLLHTIANIYGQQLTAQRVAEILSTLGLGLVARQGGRELLKLIPIPGLGSAAAGLYAAASTYALGLTLCAYFSHARAGDVPDPETLKRLYRDELAEGRRRFAEYLRPRAAGATKSETAQP